MELTEEYKEALDYLYSRLPMFSRIGAAAYKPGLETSHKLDEFFGHPHRRFKSIHIGGTNGKGSTSNLLASILQANGYKTALYTSPHLVDFRERMRINGKMIPHERVVDFVKKWKNSGYEGSPSFFELTMMMAFDWFATENVDYAVIEVGMGGRLDSTNIITPLLSVITNISYDHTQFLGSSLEQIASEKAGIIKHGIPVVIGETIPETKPVFEIKAKEEKSPLIFAEDEPELHSISRHAGLKGWDCRSDSLNFYFPLSGEYQKKNLNTALAAVKIMKEIGIELEDEKIARGIEEVEKLTGFQGRWSIITDNPLTIADTGHNVAGLQYNMAQLHDLLKQRNDAKLRMVMGFVSDKDVTHILDLLPKEAKYYITQAQIPRAMPVEELSRLFEAKGFDYTAYNDVKSAYETALAESAGEDIIYIGGSTFIVADFLAMSN